MANENKEVKFFDVNILETDFSKWELNNSSVSGASVTIKAGGYIKLDLTDVTVIKACNFVELIVQASGDITEENNYKSGIDINIEEVSVASEGSVAKRRSRNTVVTHYGAIVDGNKYTNTKQLDMLGSDMSRLTVKVINNTAQDLTIYTLAMFRSQDIETSQVHEVMQKANNVYGLVIPVLDADPINPVEGQVWIRGDLWVSK